MKLKKLITLSLATLISTSVLVGCSKKTNPDESVSDNKEKVFKVGMITQVGGINDESFNQSAWKGFKDAQEKLGKDKLEIKYLESKQESDYIKNIDTFINEKTDLIVGVGFKLEPSITESAKKNSNQQFVLVDSACQGEQPKNVTSLLYEDNVSSYLVGLIAGKMTETNKIGFIGGMQTDVIDKFDYGFRAGVKASNPDAEVVVQYANSFTDSNLGKTIANQMYSDNVDIIFTCAGELGIGAIESAKENGKKAIGVDQDQNFLAPDNVITSAMKNVDISVSEILSSLVDGSYKGGEIIVNTFAKDGVGIAPTSEKNVPPDVLGYVAQQAQKIKSGEIKVPQNKEEYEQLNK